MSAPTNTHTHTHTHILNSIKLHFDWDSQLCEQNSNELLWYLWCYLLLINTKSYIYNISSNSIICIIGWCIFHFWTGKWSGSPNKPGYSYICSLDLLSFNSHPPVMNAVHDRIITHIQAAVCPSCLQVRGGLRQLITGPTWEDKRPFTCEFTVEKLVYPHPKLMSQEMPGSNRSSLGKNMQTPQWKAPLPPPGDSNPELLCVRQHDCTTEQRHKKKINK